jgi:ribosome-associated heat shock protein Hsp15
MTAGDLVRIDKWLWAARFFKTRSLAAAAVGAGDVRVGGDRVKPARTLKIGDVLEVHRGDERMQVVVRGLDDTRGPAPVAQRLYEETAQSRTRREEHKLAKAHAVAREPASDIKGRPTKRDGRALRRLRQGS